MRKLKERILRLLQQNSNERAARLSKEYMRAASEEKEAIMAGIDFEKWLSEICEDCLD